jgi:hypothetical protein
MEKNAHLLPPSSFSPTLVIMRKTMLRIYTGLSVEQEHWQTCARRKDCGKSHLFIANKNYSDSCCASYSFSNLS